MVLLLSVWPLIRLYLPVCQYFCQESSRSVTQPWTLTTFRRYLNIHLCFHAKKNRDVCTCRFTISRFASWLRVGVQWLKVSFCRRGDDHVPAGDLWSIACGPGCVGPRSRRAGAGQHWLFNSVSLTAWQQQLINGQFDHEAWEPFGSLGAYSQEWMEWNLKYRCTAERFSSTRTKMFCRRIIKV